MFNISKESIKPLAVDEATYYRGFRYYKNKAVSNVTWSKTNQQYRATVKGGNKYMVTIDLDQKDQIQYSCNCPGHIKYSGACKHVIATLLFIENYMERANGIQPKTPEEKNIQQIITYFEQREESKVYGETFEIIPIIMIPGLLNTEHSKVYLGMQVGNQRFYKIQNIKKFLSDLNKNETIILGKEFHFFPEESHFSKDSKKVLEYFLEIYEIQEQFGKTNASTIFTRAEMTITKNMLLKFLHILENVLIKLVLYEKVYDNVRVLQENPSIGFDLEFSGSNIQLDFHDYTPVIPICEDGSILFYKNKIHLPSKEFVANYLPFYNHLGKDKNPLIFAGEHKNQFLSFILPKIYETMKVEIPEKLKEQFVTCMPKPIFYLDKLKAYIKLKVIFQYEEYRINPQTGEIPEEVVILREKKEERKILDQIESMHFIPYQDGFLLKHEEDIFCFLETHVAKLTEQFQVYYADDFKSLTIIQSGQMHSNTKIGESNHLLELELSYDNIPKEELQNLFHSLQIKKKYHRLKNGAFIDLRSKEMQDTKDLLLHLNLTSKNMIKDQIIIPSYHALYMDSLLLQMPSLDYKKSQAYQSLIDGIRCPKKRDYKIPTSVQATLRSYQVTGYKWLRSLADHFLGGILADDMGLGKTLQAITYMASIKELEKKSIFLVVCPTSVVYNWQEEIEKFTPYMKVLVIRGAPQEREMFLQKLEDIDIIITSYPLMRRDVEHYMKIEFHTMFIDEAQFIKNANSMSAKSVKKISAKHRFALTGTPIENSLWELWSIFDFILPSYLLSHNKFAQRYEKPIMRNGDQDALEDLGKHIHPFILRRMKQEVLQELPDKIESKMVCELTQQQRMLYLSYLQSVKSELFHSSEGIEKKQMELLAALTRLRQICCHPSTFMDNYKGGSGKLELLMELLENTLENGHRILIFSQFTAMLQLIEQELRQQEIEYFYLEGSTKAEVRKEYVNRFNKGERSIFLISLKAGGTGLNLTGADTVIHFDPWWNPAVEEQATDRAYRIGQLKSVQVIKLIAKDTIEEKIYKMQQKKKEISNAVIKNKEIFINALTREELEEIFRLEEDNI